MKKLLAIALCAITFSSCVKNYTDEPTIWKENKQEKMFPVYNADGTPQLVADSGYRPGPNGVPVFQATSKPRLVLRKGHDSTVHIYPPANLVKQWLGATRYYEWNLLWAFLCICAAAGLFVYGSKALITRGSAVLISITAGVFVAIGMDSITRKPFDYSRENQKWLWADDYRKELKRDSTLQTYWKEKWDRNEIQFATNPKAK
jgi:hypothetical protein